MTRSFHREASKGLDAVYHSTFTDKEPARATMVIRDRRLTVSEGHEGKPDLRIVADFATWQRFLAKETNLLGAILKRKVRIQGPLRLEVAYGRCRPS